MGKKSLCLSPQIYYPSNETLKAGTFGVFFSPKEAALAGECPHRRRRLTCADRDGANKLLPPAAAPNHQGQVCLLDQLVHRALQTSAGTTTTKKY